MSSLRIAGVHDLQFGRHQGRSFTDLDHNMVVFFGPNECGKSTLAEFLSWAIGGPWRSFKDGSDWFRVSSGDLVSGRVTGTLDGDALDLAASFKLLRLGQPNDLRTATLGGRSLDNAQVIAALRDLTAADYELVYRVYGVELGRRGSSEAFSDLFTRHAINSVNASLNPRERQKALADAAARLERELKELHTSLRATAKQIREASRNPELLSDVRSQLDQTELDVTDTNTRLSELSNNKALVVKARDGIGARQRRDQCAAKRTSLDDVPAAWIDVVLAAADVRAAHDAIDSATGQVAEARELAVAAAARVGMAPSQFTEQTFDIADRQQLQSAGSRRVQAQAAVNGAITLLRAVEHNVETATADIAPLAAGLGIDPQHVDQLTDQIEFVDALHAPMAEWQATHRDVQSKAAVVAGAQAQLDTLQQHQPLRSDHNPSTFDIRGVIIAAVLAALLAFVHPAAAVAAEALVGVVTWLLWRRSSLAPAAGPNHIDDSGTQLAEATRRLSTATGELAAATRHEHDRQRVLADRLGTSGVAMPAPDQAQACLAQLRRLATAVTTRSTARSQLPAQQQALHDAHAELAASQSQLGALLADRSVDVVPSIDGFAEWLAGYETAHTAAFHLSRCEQRLHQASDAFHNLLRPVLDQAQTMPWPQLDARLHDLQQSAADIALADGALRDAQAQVIGAGADSPSVSALLDQFPTTEALGARIQQLDDDIASIELHRTAAVEHRVALRAQIDELEGTEVLPALQLSKASTEDRIEEAVREHLAARTAATLLARVIDSYERDNQDPLVQQAQQLVQRVVSGWGSLLFSRTSAGKPVIERDGPDGRLIDDKLSDGARALLYLAIRLAFAERDAQRRGLHLPLICDDPLLHFDDQRSVAAVSMLAHVAQQHQVLMFTCEKAICELAEARGAHVIPM
ncbi:unannotated protein [freshwater metagenome]|uniref:Unannotated protein n=1 Tax=freshwater metagenome TaxID=449393 RepID=A0A6J7ESL0_9ZZZZ|nr:AAA family ATPase [Actinomycetota bacterium]